MAGRGLLSESPALLDRLRRRVEDGELGLGEGLLERWGTGLHALRTGGRLA